MKQFNNASLQTIEDFVIQTGSKMLVYAVGPIDQPNLNNYRFFQSEAEARNAYEERANEGIGATALQIEFYLDPMGYIRSRSVRTFGNWVSSATINGGRVNPETVSGSKNVSGSRVVTGKENVQTVNGKGDDFDRDQMDAQKKYHEAQAASAKVDEASANLQKASDLTDEKNAGYYDAQKNASADYDKVTAATAVKDQKELDAAVAKKAAEQAVEEYNKAQAVAQQKLQAANDAKKAADDSQDAFNKASQDVVEITEIYTQAQNAADAKYQEAVDAANAENAAIDALNEAQVEANQAVNEFQQAEAQAFNTGSTNLERKGL